MPIELRRVVYTLARPGPRTFRIFSYRVGPKDDSKYAFKIITKDCSYPLLLQVNKEARTELLKRYTLSFGPDFYRCANPSMVFEQRVYIDWTQDVMAFDWLYDLSDFLSAVAAPCSGGWPGIHPQYSISKYQMDNQHTAFEHNLRHLAVNSLTYAKLPEVFEKCKNLETLSLTCDLNSHANHFGRVWARYGIGVTAFNKLVESRRKVLEDYYEEKHKENSRPKTEIKYIVEKKWRDEFEVIREDRQDSPRKTRWSKV